MYGQFDYFLGGTEVYPHILFNVVDLLDQTSKYEFMQTSSAIYNVINSRDIHWSSEHAAFGYPLFYEISNGSKAHFVTFDSPHAPKLNEQSGSRSLSMHLGSGITKTQERRTLREIAADKRPPSCSTNYARFPSSTRYAKWCFLKWTCSARI